jgi:hypothetical protein
LAERPILFSAPMVRALLAGTKKQTRRIVKPQPDHSGPGDSGASEFIARKMRCPYGKPGDLLWVRETFGRCWDDGDGGYTAIPSHAGSPDRYFYRADFPVNDDDGGRRVWRPSIHMPRVASRIMLEVTGVRVERLQAISEADAKAEGAPCVDDFSGREVLFPAACNVGSYRIGYRVVWESINGPDSWSVNPWVWVMEFRRA